MAVQEVSLFSRLEAGHCRLLGASVEPGGVNFALAAPNAGRVELCLFDGSGRQVQSLDMPADSKVKGGGIWHGFLRGAHAGLVYGWRVHGPWNPEAGHRFNPAKLLLDPYAREVVGRYDGSDLHGGHVPGSPLQIDTRDNAATALKARVVSDLPPASRGPAIDPAQRVLYEVHVKGFTALHPDIPEPLRGTYAGLAHPAAIRHLQQLGVTTLSIMPVAHRADEARLLRLGLSNYWGYSPVAWSAPEARYWSGSAGSSVRSEFRQMVDALHAAGFEVVLDVVYNHTAETDAEGPTLSFRGIDNASYYHLDPHQPQHYLNVTGCGNSVNLQHPLVLRTVMDSLRMWVNDFGIDGFRFDLATELARGGAEQEFSFSPNAPLLMALAQDPVLRDRLLIAEPWDIGHGGYQLGHFPPGWLEWNDRFRDVQRAFWLHQREHLGALAHRLAGSTEAFNPANRNPGSSVNFVTAHDGFTLTDLVSYNQRHNLANGEGNRDGHGHNWSHNTGVEGDTDIAAVRQLRLRRKRVLLAVTILSLGTPMLLAGDETGHSQGGNNNAYCQDNPVTWIDWTGADRDLVAFVARLVRIRRHSPGWQARHWWSEAGSPVATGVIAHWLRPDGQPMTPPDWHAPHEKALMLMLEPRELAPDGSGPAEGDLRSLLLINASDTEVRFSLPPGAWVGLVDTFDGIAVDQPLGTVHNVAGGSLWVAGTRPLQNVA